LANRHSIFFISDRTGITAETLGRSLLTQFDEHAFQFIMLSYVDSDEKIENAIRRIRRAHYDSGRRPLVFSTLIDDEHRNRLAQEDFFVFDFFGSFLPALQDALQQEAHPTIGQAHGIHDLNQYLARMDAVTYSLNADDGLRTKDYENAEIILVGVSRSGKTPTCLYLAMQFGIHAANYPLVDEDLEQPRLPSPLQAYRDRIYGLSIDPVTLHRIRQSRRPDSRYASLEQCRREVRLANDMYRNERIPFLDSASMSVEEMATSLMNKTGLQRHF
jgi:regulator of PEP synthase PpsR (kinase-PPPase family)